MSTTHTVKPGENLTTIARKYGFSDWPVIYNFQSKEYRRRHPNPDLIFPGDQLDIPSKTPATPPAPEFSLTIVDSNSGTPFVNLTVRLRFPDGSESTAITDRTGTVTVISGPSCAFGLNDTFDLLDAIDGSDTPPIAYMEPKFRQSGIRVNSSFVFHIPDRRAVADNIAAKLKITRRSKWGKLTPNFVSMEQDWDYEIVALHHSGNSGESNPLEIEQKHMVTKHQWQDVGYHYIIEQDGSRFEGRHLAFKGSHVELANTGKIGILLTGDFESSRWNPNSTTPSSDQLKSAGELITELKSAFSTLKKLGGHLDYKKDTVCPGDQLYSLIPGLRTKLSLGGP
jgi:hypothetical protein